MNKKRLLLKKRVNVPKVVMVPDYSHPAWHALLSDELDNQEPPNILTTPAAFKQKIQPRTKAPKVSKRKKAHTSLSTKQLRKRLYRSGIKSVLIKGVIEEIFSGEPSLRRHSTPDSWSTLGFKNLFGKTISRRVLRFVKIGLVYLIDEAWSFLASPQVTSHIDSSLRSMRKYNSRPIEVVQSLDLFFPPAREKSAHYVSFHF